MDIKQQQVRVANYTVFILQYIVHISSTCITAQYRQLCLYYVEKVMLVELDSSV